MDTRLGLPHQEECEYVKYNQPRNRPRALRGGANGRRSATSEQPGNPREHELQEEIRLDKHEFYLILRYVITVDEYVIAKMIAEVEATSWRLRETIRVREFAATRTLGQMRRLLILEEKKAWKQEFGFDRIKMAAEMDEKRFRTSLFHTLLLQEYVESEAPTYP